MRWDKFVMVYRLVADSGPLETGSVRDGEKIRASILPGLDCGLDRRRRKERERCFTWRSAQTGAVTWLSDPVSYCVLKS